MNYWAKTKKTPGRFIIKSVVAAANDTKNFMRTSKTLQFPSSLLNQVHDLSIHTCKISSNLKEMQNEIPT